MQQQITTMDGNIEPPPTELSAVSTNKIKINITKTNAIKHNMYYNDNNNSSNSNDPINNQAKQPVIPPPDIEPNIDFNIKPSLHGVNFKKQIRFKSGFETSGLCSIM